MPAGTTYTGRYRRSPQYAAAPSQPATAQPVYDAQTQAYIAQNNAILAEINKGKIAYTHCPLGFSSWPFLAGWESRIIRLLMTWIIISFCIHIYHSGKSFFVWIAQVCSPSGHRYQLGQGICSLRYWQSQDKSLFHKHIWTVFIWTFVYWFFSGNIENYGLDPAFAFLPSGPVGPAIPGDPTLSFFKKGNADVAGKNKIHSTRGPLPHVFSQLGLLLCAFSLFVWSMSQNSV